MDALIANAIEQTSIPKEVLLRKKWLNAIHQHVLSKGDEQDYLITCWDGVTNTYQTAY